MDIVERLRSYTENDAYADPFTFGIYIFEAADEIERLREERNALRDALFSAFYHFSNSHYQDSHDVLRSALKESE